MISPTDEMYRVAHELLFPWTDARSPALRDALTRVLAIIERDYRIEPRPSPACGYPISHPAHRFARPNEDRDGEFGPAQDCAGVPGDWTQPMDRDVTS